MSAENTTWVFDPSHSELTFKVRHMMIAHVKGEFQSFQVQVTGSDLFTAALDVSVDVASIDTNNEQRDQHLRAGDFFDVENHPKLTFQAASLKPGAGEGAYVLTGTLTIKGVSKEVTFDVEFGGLGRDPWGNEKAGFSFSGAINRTDFHLNWNAALETGGVLVGEEVKFAGEIQFAKQSA
jgi:polyisoprenoid-binding protein YceI